MEHKDSVTGQRAEVRLEGRGTGRAAHGKLGVDVMQKSPSRRGFLYVGVAQTHRSWGQKAWDGVRGI